MLAPTRPLQPAPACLPLPVLSVRVQRRGGFISLLPRCWFGSGLNGLTWLPGPLSLSVAAYVRPHFEGIHSLSAPGSAFEAPALLSRGAFVASCGWATPGSSRPRRAAVVLAISPRPLCSPPAPLLAVPAGECVATAPSFPQHLSCDTLTPP